MPDIEKLMQVWPPEFEEALRNLKVPPAELDVSLEEYAQICCNLMDIPMHKSAVQSLHVFFTLFSEFVGNQHFIVGAADAAKAAMQSDNSESQTMVLDNSEDNDYNFDSKDAKNDDREGK